MADAVMSIYAAVSLLFLVQLWAARKGALAQEVPSFPCPNYFEYQRYGNEYIGLVTLPNIKLGVTRVDIQLKQREPVSSSYYGRLSLYESQEATLRNINNGLPVSYRMDFPISNILPKLLRIAINGADVCVSSDFSLGTILNLQHTLQTSTEYRDPNAPVVTTNQPTSTVTYVPPQFTGLPGNSFNSPERTQQSTSFNSPGRTPQRTSPIIQTYPEIKNDFTPQVSSRECGVSGAQQSRSKRLIAVNGGDRIDRGQHPWLTAVYEKQPSNLQFLCGGSLISARSVLTAAHGFNLKGLSAQQVAVYLGRHNLQNYGEKGVVARDVATLIIHPQYDPELFPDADLAILQISSPVDFTQYISPICLWNEPTDVSLIAGQMGFVAGWGADGEGREVTDTPKVVGGNIVGDGDCARSTKALTSTRTICAGNLDGSGPCMGDSGGGLMLQRHGIWKLRGVVSAGQTEARNCKLDEYVIYCDLAKHLDWVRSNVV